MAIANTILLKFLGKEISFIDLEMSNLYSDHTPIATFTRYGLVVAVQVPAPDTPIESQLLVQETTGLTYYDLSLIEILTVQ